MDEDEDIPFLAARMARLFEEQQESLLEEIQDINANFWKAQRNRQCWGPYSQTPSTFLNRNMLMHPSNSTPEQSTQM